MNSLVNDAVHFDDQMFRKVIKLKSSVIIPNILGFKEGKL